MASQDRAERLRQVIVEAAARLEATGQGPKRGNVGPAPGDLYVFETPVESAIEWLVVRCDVDDPATVLLALADDMPLAGRCDIGLWPEFLNRPAWLVAETELALAASPGGGLTADVAESLASASPRYAEVPLQTGGTLLLAADAGGVRLGWHGPEHTAPPQLTGFGSRGKQVAIWTNGERPGFHRAEPDFGWSDGQVVFQAGSENRQTITVRL